MIIQNEELNQELENLRSLKKVQKVEILALKDSNQKLATEIAVNLKTIAEKDVQLRNIMKFQDEPQDMQEGEMSVEQKKQLYFAQMELERVRKLITCKACNEREKEVILLTCFHCFCEKCVDKNF